MGSFLTICQMCLLFPNLVDGYGCSTGLGSGIEDTVNFKTWVCLIVWWLWRRVTAAEALVQILGEA